MIASLDLRQLSAVLAGLRLLQAEPTLANSDILTDAGRIAPPSAEEIDDLCERLNTAPDGVTIGLHMRGGVCEEIRASTPIAAAVIADADIYDGGSDTEISGYEAASATVNALEYSG